MEISTDDGLPIKVNLVIAAQLSCFAEMAARKMAKEVGVDNLSKLVIGGN